ncbi:MAG: CBS domain-containing protein [Gammaproteobacteria bacterium]|nr:CBS domain-containing protein [Gammaproteobacteria bacterium]
MSDKKITRQDFVNALKDMNTYMDISVDDLMTINEKANQYAQMRLSQKIVVEDIMTQPVFTIKGECTIAAAAELMLEKHVAGLPVVDAGDKLTGIFTEADLLTAVGLPRHKPPQSVWSRLESIFLHEPSLGNFNSTVSELMIKNVVTIHRKNTLGDVLTKMRDFNIKRLVVTEDEKAVGIITRSNLVRVFLGQLSRPK